MLIIAGGQRLPVCEEPRAWSGSQHWGTCPCLCLPCLCMWAPSPLPAQADTVGSLPRKAVSRRVPLGAETRPEKTFGQSPTVTGQHSGPSPSCSCSGPGSLPHRRPLPRVLSPVKRTWPPDSAPGISPRGTKTPVPANTCTRVFTAAFVMKPQGGNQPAFLHLLSGERRRGLSYNEYLWQKVNQALVLPPRGRSLKSPAAWKPTHGPPRRPRCERLRAANPARMRGCWAEGGDGATTKGRAVSLGVMTLF